MQRWPARGGAASEVTFAEAARRWRLATARLKEIEVEERQGQLVDKDEMLHATEQTFSNVTAYNGTETSLELLVNYSRENCGQIYVQPTDCFLNIIECSLIFESRFAAFDFGPVEMQVEYSKPETVLRVLDQFRSAVAKYAKERERRTSPRKRRNRSAAVRARVIDPSRAPTCADGTPSGHHPDLGRLDRPRCDA